jgi:hypothetical protein
MAMAAGGGGVNGSRRRAARKERDGDAWLPRVALGVRGSVEWQALTQQVYLDLQRAMERNGVQFLGDLSEDEKLLMIDDVEAAQAGGTVYRNFTKMLNERLEAGVLEQLDEREEREVVRGGAAAPGSPPLSPLGSGSAAPGSPLGAGAGAAPGSPLRAAGALALALRSVGGGALALGGAGGGGGGGGAGRPVLAGGPGAPLGSPLGSPLSSPLGLAPPLLALGEEEEHKEAAPAKRESAYSHKWRRAGRSRADAMVEIAARGVSQMLSKLPTTLTMVRLLLNQTIPMVLRAQVWELVLRSPAASEAYRSRLAARRVGTIAASDADVTDRCQEVVEAEFPELEKQSETAMVAKTVLSYRLTAHGAIEDCDFYLVVPCIIVLAKSFDDVPRVVEAMSTLADTPRPRVPLGAAEAATSSSSSPQRERAAEQLCAMLKEHDPELFAHLCSVLSAAELEKERLRENAKRDSQEENEGEGEGDKEGKVEGPKEQGAKPLPGAGAGAGAGAAAAAATTAAAAATSTAAKKGEAKPANNNEEENKEKKAAEGEAGHDQGEAGKKPADSGASAKPGETATMAEGASQGAADAAGNVTVADAAAAASPGWHPGCKHLLLNLVRRPVELCFVGTLSLETLLYAWDQCVLVGFDRLVLPLTVCVLVLIREQLTSKHSVVALEQAIASQSRRIKPHDLAAMAERKYLGAVRNELGIPLRNTSHFKDDPVDALDKLEWLEFAMPPTEPEEDKPLPANESAEEVRKRLEAAALAGGAGQPATAAVGWGDRDDSDAELDGAIKLPPVDKRVHGLADTLRRAALINPDADTERLLGALFAEHPAWKGQDAKASVLKIKSLSPTDSAAVAVFRLLRPGEGRDMAMEIVRHELRRIGATDEHAAKIANRVVVMSKAEQNKKGQQGEPDEATPAPAAQQEPAKAQLDSSGLKLPPVKPPLTELSCTLRRAKLLNPDAEPEQLEKALLALHPDMKLQSADLPVLKVDLQGGRTGVFRALKPGEPLALAADIVRFELDRHAISDEALAAKLGTAIVLFSQKEADYKVLDGAPELKSVILETVAAIKAIRALAADAPRGRAAGGGHRAHQVTDD